MTARLLFEHDYRGDRWRLEVATHCGRTFGNWRRWWFDGSAWQPSKEGATFPLERLPDLHAALTAYLADNASSGPPSAS